MKKGQRVIITIKGSVFEALRGTLSKKATPKSWWVNLDIDGRNETEFFENEMKVIIEKKRKAAAK